MDEKYCMNCSYSTQNINDINYHIENNHKFTYGQVTNTKILSIPEIIEDDLDDTSKYEELENNYLNNAKYNSKQYLNKNTKTIKLNRKYIKSAKYYIKSQNYVEKSPKNSNEILTQENYNEKLDKLISTTKSMLVIRGVQLVTLDTIQKNLLTKKNISVLDSNKSKEEAAMKTLFGHICTTRLKMPKDIFANLHVVKMLKITQ